MNKVFNIIRKRGDTNPGTTSKLARAKSESVKVTALAAALAAVMAGEALAAAAAPTRSQTGPDANAVQNNPATMGDVLNAGWNLQNNGAAVNFVKPYDNVNFTYGIGTTIETKSAGKTNTIKVNTATQYTDEKGRPVTVIYGRGYELGSIQAPQTEEDKRNNWRMVYAPGTPLKEDGTAVNPNTPDTEPLTRTPRISLVGGDQTSTKPIMLSNVAQGTNTYSGQGVDDGTGSGGKTPLVKVGKVFYKATDFTNGVLNDDAKPLVKENGKYYYAENRLEPYWLTPDAVELTDLTNPADIARTGLADLDHSEPNNAINVADARNLGWIVSSDKKTDGTGEYADKVTNAQEVKFVGKNGVKVSGNTTGDVRTITIETDAVNANHLKQEVDNVYNALGDVDKNLRAGVAGAMASSGLYQVTLPGKTMLAASIAGYKGAGAIAVGFSSLTSDGKLGIKASINANSRGDAGGVASFGYQW